MQNLALTMVVTNIQKLESGTSPKIKWTENGGTIGSGFSDEWVLRDNLNQVKPSHCELLIVDGAYCIKDTSGETYVNGASMPLGKFGMAKLADRDELKIGPYYIRVELRNEMQEDIASQELDQLIPFDNKGLLDDDEDEDLVVSSEEDDGVYDPLQALDEVMGKPDDGMSLINPEKVADEFDNELSIEKNSHLISEDLGSLEADGENKMTSSISLKKILGFGLSKHSKGDKSSSKNSKNNVTNNQTENNNVENDMFWQSKGDGMDDNVLDLLEEEVAKSMTSSTTSSQRGAADGSSDHLLTGPMLHGMGIDSLGSNDMEQMHMLSEELGESLKACVEGLLDLHQQVSNGHFGMMNRNLQPIEDNPLRLGLDYEETMKTMYDADKSLVHLSAPAAISESLKNIRDHNEALQQATAEALQQILAAFSPQVLLRRFNSYKRSADTNQSNDSWAWNMYCSYYKELTSSRQKGFEKLFWEIFEQAYDKKIREKQLEF